MPTTHSERLPVMAVFKVKNMYMCTHVYESYCGLKDELECFSSTATSRSYLWETTRLMTLPLASAVLCV